MNSALGLIDRGRDLFREHWDHSLIFQYSIKFLEELVLYSCPKYLAHPSGWKAGLMILCFCHSSENFKLLSLSLLKCFGLIICIWLGKDEFRSADEYFYKLTCVLSQSLISRIVICNTLVENWDHIIFPSLFILFPYISTHNE